MMLNIYDIAPKSLIVAAFIFVALLIVKNKSASLKSSLIDCGLLVLLCLPFVNIIQGLVPNLNPKEIQIIDYNQSYITPTDNETSNLDSNIIMIIGMIYILGVVALTLNLLVSLIRLKVFSSKIKSSQCKNWAAAIELARLKLGYCREIEILFNEKISSPISWGIFKPVIMASHDKIDKQNDINAIVIHEMAHLKRFDWLRMIVAEIAKALFWLNPIVWILVNKSNQFREEAVDDLVLHSEINTHDYAQMLVKMARFNNSQRYIMANGVMQNENGLKVRVGRILNSAAERKAVTKTGVAITLGLLATMTCAVGTALSFTTGKKSEKSPIIVKSVQNKDNDTILVKDKNNNYIRLEELPPSEQERVRKIVKDSQKSVTEAQKNAAKAIEHANTKLMATNIIQSHETDNKMSRGDIDAIVNDAMKSADNAIASANIAIANANISEMKADEFRKKMEIAAEKYKKAYGNESYNNDSKNNIYDNYNSKEVQDAIREATRQAHEAAMQAKKHPKNKVIISPRGITIIQDGEKVSLNAKDLNELNDKFN